MATAPLRRTFRTRRVISVASALMNRPPDGSTALPVQCAGRADKDLALISRTYIHCRASRPPPPGAAVRVLAGSHLQRTSGARCRRIITISCLSVCIRLTSERERERVYLLEKKHTQHNKTVKILRAGCQKGHSPSCWPPMIYNVLYLTHIEGT